MSEKELIIQAIKEFSEKMLERMLDKYQVGYRGWLDPERMSYYKLKNAIRNDISKKDKEIDIANRAMILWWRRKQNENLRNERDS